MAIIDVVKWESNQNDFCFKFPSQDIRIGSQLVVNTSQTAFFVKGGKIFDDFTSGTYTINTDNIPLLNKILNIPFGGQSPFQAEIWFINQITRLDLKFGTPSPIQLEDPKYGIIIPVRAFGQYGIRVSNPRRLLETLVGNMSSFSSESIERYFKGILIANLNSVIAKRITTERISILDIQTQLVELSSYCTTEINSTFEKYGISLVELSIMSINAPQDDPSFIRLKEAKATIARLNITGRDVYQMERSFDVLEKAAGNPGAGSQITGVGVGLGIGNVMSGIVGQTVNPIAPPPPGQLFYVYVNGQQLSGKTIESLKQMKDHGQINDDTLVWTIGMASWMPIKSVSALSSLCPPPIPPISPIE